MMDYSGDQDRMLANLVRLGTVKELDAAGAKVRVQMGDLSSAWLPWVTSMAGGDRAYSAPEVGSQVVVLSPSGEITQGVVLPAIYQQQYGPNADSVDVRRITWADGTVVEYDRAAHRLLADLGQSKITATRSMVLLESNGCSIKIEGGGITVVGNITQTGSIQTSGSISAVGSVSTQGSVSAAGDVSAAGTSLQNHRHGGVTPGNGQTGTPA